MIILDTNVISELMKDYPDQSVRNWISSQKQSQLAITTITIAEIQRGISRLPAGKRQDKLETNFLAFIGQAFSGRVFSFDEPAAYLYGELASEREKIGLQADAVDLMIAAIVNTNNAMLATRNVKDFTHCGFTIINPWSEN